MLNLHLPKNSGQKLKYTHLPGSSISYVIAEIAKQAHCPVIVIAPDSLTQQKLEIEIDFFISKNYSHPILTLPDRETLPYDMFSPHHDIISERLHTLYHLPQLKYGIVFTSISTIMHLLPPVEFLAHQAFIHKIGDHIDIENFRQRLIFAGYYAVNQVAEHGEFAIRGSIIDVFPTGSKEPFRLDLFDNEIESIKTFDPETQRSLENLESIELLPAREFPLTDEAIELFRQNWRSRFEGNPLHSPIYQAISAGHTIGGIEYYLPLFFDKLANFTDYLPKNSLIIRIDKLHEASEHFEKEVSARFQDRQIDRTRPLLSTQELFLPSSKVLENINQFSQIFLQKDKSLTDIKTNLNFTSIPEVGIQRQLQNPLQALLNYVSQHQARILFCAESAGRREALLNLIKNLIQIKSYDNWGDFLNDNEPYGICIALLEKGFVFEESNIAVISEAEIFGSPVLQTRRKFKEKSFASDAVIKNLLELSIGDPVVHIQHGIGRYHGLQKLTVNNIETEFLTITYANNDKLYVPVASLHLISRYNSPDSDHVPSHKLGSDHWNKAKQKALEKINDVAAELLELHAKRALKPGHVYQLDESQYTIFSSAFPFETTYDQEKAINDVYIDMQSEKTMDRLICGDVGFGKTEVAMRAAFLAVLNQKQVAILVPTTLLAQQHYQTFCDRFADWPIKIDVISRFKTGKEQTSLLKEIEENKCDIVVGTHKLLQKDIKFANLGLLIIDEEHRFGVDQKEKLKSLRAEVDILTLTATPIPRTLNMAMSGARDLSIITTPPAKRLAIKTFVHEYNKELIREAIIREIMRGGQVYYLHNDVSTIEKTVHTLQEYIPEIKAAFAHGQMHERELEKVMSDFYHNRFNVLVCTTIVESGIDIPTANTIIMERADKFGLAQLHQLRGRVGRSHHQAYAYLLIPPKELITADATKRLDAIASLEDLGAGFMLATHDLEIRGAGEILGHEQSGHMNAIGFDLYMTLLERAVKSMKSGKILNLESIQEDNIEVDLKIPALIPEDYLENVHTRLILYKRIANAKNISELDELQVEMIDRFGLLPQQCKNLFAITELKLKAQPLGIKKIEGSIYEGVIHFCEEPNIDPARIIQLIQTQSQKYKLAGQNKLKFILLDGKQENLVEKIQEILGELQANAP